MKIHWTESYAKGALADYDNDGDLDLYITAVYQGDKGTLFENDGTGKFKDVGEATGTRTGHSYQIAWADYDNDGFQDLMVQGKLLRNPWQRERVAEGPTSGRQIQCHLYWRARNDYGKRQNADPRGVRR